MLLSRLPKADIILSTTIIVAAFANGCAAEASKNSVDENPTKTSKISSINIQPNSPADTVRVFYKRLREKKFREALFLTNLRPAIEGLTDNELKEFQVDFDTISSHVPADFEINGEIITGDSASVTAKLPNKDLEKDELQEIQLRRESGVWVILTVDDEAEKLIKQEGKNYFYALRIETHHEEAKAMLERISKAQTAHALQNGGKYAEMPVLIEAGFLPTDVLSSETTGYLYAVKLTNYNKRYFATATPAVYGKSGKISYLLEPDGITLSRVTSKDTKGQPMKK